MANRIPISLFLFLFALYLFTYSPTLHSSDGQAMFSTAESLLRRGAWDIEQIRWMGLQQGTYGLDGLLYSRKGIGQPLLALPLTWLGLVTPWFGPVTLTVLFGSLITALTGVLVYQVLVRLVYNTQASLLAALIFGSGTLAWPYAKTFFSDSLAGFLLLATLLALLYFKQTGRNRFAFLAGSSLAWAVATRYAEGVFLPVFGLYFLHSLTSNLALNEIKTTLRDPSYRRAFVVSSLSFGLPILVVGLGLMGFNFSRYGDLVNTGYLPEESFSAIWWQGIYGQLLSPGRGLLLYSPILIVSFFGLKSFWQRQRPEAWTILAVILIHLLLYGKWFMWHGGFAWGPRFMVPTLPFWVLLMAPVLTRLPAKPKWRYGFFALWVVSLVVQIPGSMVDFDHWQNQLLQTGLPMFDPVTFFSPIYSPLLNTWQFIVLANLDVAWVAGGSINWLLLGVLVSNLGVAGWLLIRPATKWRILSTILTLVATGVLLQQAHDHQAPKIADATTIINQTDAAILYDQPDIAIPLAETYKGHAPVLGLATLETDKLDAFTGENASVWWLGAYQNDLESYLTRQYGIARHESQEDQRLLLLARPDGVAQPTNHHFGNHTSGNIKLEQVHLSERLQSNTPLAVTFTWQAEATPQTDYQIFIHLIDSSGQVVAQTDGQPANWARPTTTWQPGETIIDRHALWPGALSGGQYTLIAGLYHPASGERLLTKTGDHFITLGTFTVLS